jgi:hypothetical protein
VSSTNPISKLKKKKKKKIRKFKDYGFRFEKKQKIKNKQINKRMKAKKPEDLWADKCQEILNKFQ